MIKTFTINEEYINQRIDKVLADFCPEISRANIQNLGEQNKIKLNNNMLNKLSIKTKLNDVLEIDIPEQEPLDIKGKELDLDILFEDDDIIVVNKPRGLTMYPGPGHLDNLTLASGLLHHTNGHLSKIGGENRPGIVHRIDKDTSGIVVVAKTDSAYYELTKMFSEHNLIRKYTCFCWGVPNSDSATITGNIDRHFKNRQKMSMVKTGGKYAETEIELMDFWGLVNVSKIHCTLKTGRTHQIRVHLSANKLPLIGDDLYGKDKNNMLKIDINSDFWKFLKEHRGQLLHADTLEFIHPITKEKLNFQTELPLDMLEFEECLNDYTPTKK